MLRLFLILATLLVSPLIAAPQEAIIPVTSEAASPTPLPSLRELARSRGKQLGTNFPHLLCVSKDDHSLKPGWLERHSAELDLIRTHFTLVGAGWQMFPGHAWPAADTFCLEGNHAFIDWARSQNLDVTFHGLGYIQRGWPNFEHKRQEEAKALYDTPEEQAAFRETYRCYLDAFLGNFAKKVGSWDVLNENVRYGRYSAIGYNTFPYLSSWGAGTNETVYGINYYIETIRRARELDPDGKLIYLDYCNEIICAKSNSQYYAVCELIRSDARPDAIGFQLHQKINFNRTVDRDPAGVAAAPAIGKETTFHNLTDIAFLDSMRENIQRYADLGLEVWVLELDVDAPLWQNLTERRARQAFVYRKFLEICLEFPNFPVFKLWGTRDTDKDIYLFDAQGQPKPAARAIADTFKIYWPKVHWSEPAPHTLLSGTPKAAETEFTLPLKNTYNAHLAYRWRWSNPPPPGIRVIVETALPDGTWRELKRHDDTEYSFRKIEGDFPVPAFCTLDGLDGIDDVPVRFRLEGKTEADTPSFEFIGLKMIADTP